MNNVGESTSSTTTIADDAASLDISKIVDEVQQHAETALQCATNASQSLTAAQASQTAVANIQSQMADGLTAVASIATEAQTLQTQLNDAHTQIEAISKQIEAIAQAVNQHDSDTQSYKANSEALLQQIQTLEADAQTSKASIDTLLGEVKSAEQIGKTSIASIQAAEAETKQNKEQIQNMLSRLDTAAKSIDARVKVFETFVEQSDKRMNEITSQAESMLAGATNASLSSSFKKEADALEEKSKWAQIWFSIGIVALFASLAPLLTLLFGENSPKVTLESILARSVLIAPAIWFCSFMARRYSALFELRHHYGHKHNMTFSLNAFKKQLSEDSSGLIQEVFSSISRNPAEILRRHQKMSDGPFSSLLGRNQTSPTDGHD